MSEFIDTESHDCPVLKCPVCGFEYTHIEQVEVTPGGCRLLGWCEHWDAFYLTFKHHKGVTMISGGRLPDSFLKKWGW